MGDFVNKAAWAKLVHRVVRKTNNNCDAEDFLNSAYLRLEGYSADHKVGDPSAFLVRTALNISIDKFRHDRLSSENIDQLEIQDFSPLQDEVIAARARLERVTEGLARLSPQAREVLLMRRLDGKSYDEIATHLGVSRSTVERIVAKATTFLIEWSKGW
jgi:RNA polymerase sigma factor (sigma-70 family)